jgi:hypothetical protein
MDCKRVASPTRAAPPSRAAALCNPCDKAVSFSDWRDNACVRDGRKADDKCCAQNY